MNFSRLILLLSIIFANQSVFSQWYSQASGTYAHLQDVFFLNADTGYAVGGLGKILKTTNGGQTWDFKTLNFNYVVTRVIFINNNLGFATAYNESNTHMNYMYRTTNGGLNWVLNYESSPLKIGGINFTGNTTGFIGASRCDSTSITKVYRTSTQGNTWVTVSSLDTCALNSIKFIDSTGYWTGRTRGLIFKTTNYGLNWLETNVGYIDELCDIHMFNKDTVIVTGILGKMWRTTNGGNNWNIVSTATGYDLLRICFPDSITGYIATNSFNFMKSTDAGLTWGLYSTGSNNPINAIFFINSQTGFAVGQNGTILKTTNGGGVIGIHTISNEVPEHFKLFQNYPNPFNPITKINFSIPNVETTRRVVSARLIIYDLLGKEVITLIEEQLKPGSYEIEWDASNFPSGVYFYKLQSEGFTAARKMILIK